MCHVSVNLVLVFCCIPFVFVTRGCRTFWFTRGKVGRPSCNSIKIYSIWWSWSIEKCLFRCIKFSRVLPLSSIQKCTQEDYYGRRCGILLHSSCTGTFTEVTVLLLWSSSNATLEYPRRYSNRVAVWVLHGNGRVTSQEQHFYFSVGTSAVTV